MGVCCYHWLDNSAPGQEQAREAIALMRELGGPDGMAHQCDSEDDATEQVWRSYMGEMQEQLGRHVVAYTGRWWWAPRGWTGADLTPHLWAMPQPGPYPGDTSPLWNVDYGGWTELALLQYNVAPVAGVNCTLSALRDPQVWAELTGGPVPTYAELQAEPWWGREIVTAELDYLGDELCRRTGRPRVAAPRSGSRTVGTAPTASTPCKLGSPPPNSGTSPASTSTPAPWNR
jgi:hypothetical protein